MDTQAVKERVTALVEQKFEAEPEFFLVDIKQAGTKLTVFIDGDKGITIGKCQTVSRYLEKYLDEELILGEKYTLDVSSPGISNPFKVRRQYKRYIGKQIRVLTDDGEQLECTLKKVDDTQIEVEYIETIKGKVISRKLFEIKFDTIKSTKLILNF